MLNYAKRILSWASAAFLLLTSPLVIDAGKQAFDTFFNKRDQNLTRIVEQYLSPSSASAAEVVAMAKQMDVYKYSDLINKGHDYQIKGEFKKAIDVYDEAIDGIKEHPTGYVNKSTAYSDWADSILKNNPKKAKELYVLSNEFAIIALEKLEANKTGMSEKDIRVLTSGVYGTMGLNYKSLGNKEKAIEFLEKSVQLGHFKPFEDALKELRGS